MRSQALHIGVKAPTSATYGIEEPLLKPLSQKELRLNPGTGDKVGKGIDVALVTLAFLGIGYAVDRWLGTKPWFMVGLVVLGLIGEFLRFWYDYDARMKVLEAQRAASVRAPSSKGDHP
jgi:ATP synthase protein I